jgi:hypothetical protein
MADKGKYSILADAVMLIRSDNTYGPRLSNCWLPASTWVEALRKSGLIDASLIIDVGKFNAAMSKSASFGEAMHRFDGSNTTGVFRIKFQKSFYYCFTDKSRQIKYPCPLNNAWKEKVIEAAANVLVVPSTRARPTSTVDSSVHVSRADADANEGDQESPNKRQRVHNVAAGAFAYWPESPEAYHLFRPRRECSGGSATTSTPSSTTADTTMAYIESPKEALQHRILQLQAVHESEDSWRGVVKGGDPDNYCTKIEIFEIRQRSTFLCLAYQLALTNMNRWTWHECCKEACKTLNSLGMKQATFYKTVAQWNIVFRKFKSFPHPNPYVQCGKRPLPRLLEIYPDAKDQIVSFGVKNLAKLTIESVHDFIVTTVIPRLALLWQKDEEAAAAPATADLSAISTSMTSINTINIQLTGTAEDNQEVVNKLFLRAYGLESMSFTTAWRWMRLLGFSYDTRKKSFYVDGHEREDVVANRTQFCTSYLTELEPYCNRWVRMSISKAMTMTDIDVEEMGHKYFDIISNEECIEFHIDYWNRFRGQERIEPTTSIRVSPMARPIMIVGQDESVFAQYLLGAKTWIGPKGQRPLLPKSEGDGYMLSAFVSRKFGFGRQLTDIELAKINNETRQTNGATYTDTQAAMEILGTINKAPFTESPFVKYLYIGVNNEGYWNSFHMSLQFEDVVDCLRVLYPNFDFVFMFDHSQGHARKREQALSAQQMSKSYGGAQPRMRDTTILAEEGFLGPHLPMLRVGDTQSLTYTVDDTGAMVPDTGTTRNSTPQPANRKEQEF